jgi:TonB family protein
MRCVRQIPVVLALLGAGLSPVWAADTDKACSAPEVPLRPIMATHTIPLYPQVSVMTNEQGSTMLEVHIGADGVPDAAKVVNSSGSMRLDAAAVEHVKSTWRWNAPVHNCQPLAVSTRVSILWDLRDARNTGPLPPTVNMDIKDYPPGARQRHEQGTVYLWILISPDGSVSATVQTSSGFPELDQKSLDLARNWLWKPAHLGDQAVVTPVYLLSVWSLDPKK